MIILTSDFVDIEALEKGDHITVPVIEAITGEIEGTSAYALATLSLKEEIEALLWSNQNRFTLKQEGGGIRLLTDPEAAEYNERQGEAARRKLARAHRRNRAVDETNLSEADQQRHDRVVEIQGRYLQAINNVRKELRIEPTHRRTPALI